MIRFKKVRWKNFLSTGNLFTEIQLDKTETTLVIGENGAGKSTMLDALCFVLFNKPYRTVNLPQLVCSVNERDCVVEVEFTDGSSDYRVVRGQSPKVFEIWVDGELLDQDAKARDYQRTLEDTILGMNHRSFCQVVILGSANYIPFMRLTAADRRGVVESILDIGVFSDMNAVLKERISTNKEELRHAESAIAVARERLSLLRKMVDEERKRRQTDDAWLTEQTATINATIAKCEADAAAYTKQIQELTESISDEDAVTDKSDKYRTLRSQFEKRIGSIRKEIGFYEANSTCPTCTQEIDQAFRDAAVSRGNGRIDEMGKALSEMQSHEQEASKRLSEIATVVRKVKELNAAVVKAANEVESSKRHLSKLTLKPTTATDSEPDLDKAVTAESEAVEVKRELVEDQHYLSLASTMLKDSGIKGRIIHNYIPVINETINKYLAKMNFFVDFRLDEEFTETIKSRHRDEFTYASFSEGEKRKIDLALLFAWRRIASLKNSVTTNLLILDEILDGSLDDHGTDAFLDIVRSLDKGTNTFVISHKPREMLESKFNRTIEFAKRGNFSRLV